MIYYKLEKYDDNFDWINGDLPDEIIHHFGDQLIRARSLLKNRRQQEIAYALSSLDWMLKKGSELFSSNIEELFKTSGNIFTNRVKALKYLQDEIELDGQRQFKNATWHEYYAILTLACIGESLDILHEDETAEEVFVSEEMAKSLLDSKNRLLDKKALEAMDSIGFAEQCKIVFDIHNKELSSYKDRGSKGGQIRSNKYSQLRELSIQLYLERYSHLSALGAAKKIVEELPEEELDILDSDTPWETVAAYIRSYNKECKKKAKKMWV